MKSKVCEEDGKPFVVESEGSFIIIVSDSQPVLQEKEKESVPRREANKLQGKKERNVRGVLYNQNRTPEITEIPEGARLSENASEVKPLMAQEEDQGSVTTGFIQPVYLKLKEDNGYELVEKDDKSVSPAALEVFQARQKMLEEQNKKRKEMLAKVLDDRRKQTQEEAKRLKNIQQELHKLDLILSNDVGILRDQIESASIEFGEAQKRYNKAEKEYIEAKHSLFNKLERKEMLTKHLCTIIEQNEMRKAQKLSELMEKLRINESSPDTKSNLTTVITSPYYESALKDEKTKEHVNGNDTGHDSGESEKANT